ncbi:TPA: hypothetical protein I8672_003368 [Legionella pneumophila]|nr:hypothetical protein [Legionella pneumophila]HBD7284166.1 hypothetical protein [Legionella pneumophila]HEN8242155.1 hypothetical protein [Legionella pneumophila]
MNSLLDIKQDLLLTPMAGPLPAISNQQSALDFPLFSSFSTFYGFYFLYSGFRFISLLYLNPMLHVRAFTLMLFQSIAAEGLLCSLNDSFLLCKERL